MERKIRILKKQYKQKDMAEKKESTGAGARGGRTDGRERDGIQENGGHNGNGREKESGNVANE